MSSTTIHSLPPYQPYNLTVRKRQITFYEWLDSPVEDLGGIIGDADPTTHADYIKYFHSCINDILDDNKLQIHKKKEFKNELATFIYRTSDEPEKCHV